jgi:outer membrane protein assembly factor BamB
MFAQEWPQFLGPDRDGQYVGPALNTSWPAGKPEELWRRSVGEGFAGPVVAENRLLLFHRVDNREVLEAMDAVSGAPIWRHHYTTTYRDDFGFDEGPRAVPVVANGTVYTFGAQGDLYAVGLETGETLWHVDTKDRFRFRKGFFGAAGSPLVDDGRVMVNVGGENAGIVAFDAASGDILWTATSDEASYSSAVAADFRGMKHAIFFTRTGLVGLNPINGELRFDQRWQSRLGASVNAATPLIIGDLIFVSASYGTGAAVFQVDGARLIRIWSSDDALSNHYATSVHHNGYLYGYHGRQEYRPSLRAVDLRTGSVQWTVDEFQAGSVTLAGDQLVIVKETGELIIAQATPTSFTPIARTKVLPSVVRAYPAIAKGLVYIRNEDTLICLDLRSKS